MLLNQIKLLEWKEQELSLCFKIQIFSKGMCETWDGWPEPACLSWGSCCLCPCPRALAISFSLGNQSENAGRPLSKLNLCIPNLMQSSALCRLLIVKITWFHNKIKHLTCCTKATCVSGNIICKDNRPHTGLTRPTFTHQQHLMKKWEKTMKLEI